MAQRDVDMRERVAGWLEKEGYAIEMTVARAFKSRDFRVHQSHWFTDPNTTKSREIDVLATAERNINGRIVRVVFVIECKWSHDKPWIMFTDHIHLGDQSVRHRSGSSLGRTLLEWGSTDVFLRDIGLFFVPKQPAYAVVTAFGGEDRAYSAISSVASATSSIVQLIELAPIAAILFPIIILDGRLFSCCLAQDGKTQIEEVSGGVLVWRKPAAGIPRTIIHLITMSDLGSLVAKAEETAHHLLNLDPVLVEHALGKVQGGDGPDDPAMDF